MIIGVYDPREIRAALSPLGFRFSKALGQNFLTDPEVPRRIAALLPQNCGVLEIGPGFGALTEALIPAADKLVCVEADGRLATLLSGRYAGREHVSVIHGDALKTDLSAIAIESFAGLTPAVAANLPYSVTSPMLQTLVGAAPYKRMALMVQREVANRLCAAPGTPDFSAFTLFVSVFCDCRTIFTVPPECFMPRPEVVSAVITLDRLDEPRVDERSQRLFFRLTRAAFSMRRKTLVNALSALFPLSKAELTARISEAGIDPSARGETLGIDGFLSLCRVFDKE